MATFTGRRLRWVGTCVRRADRPRKREGEPEDSHREWIAHDSAPRPALGFP